MKEVKLPAEISKIITNGCTLTFTSEVIELISMYNDQTFVFVCTNFSKKYGLKIHMKAFDKLEENQNER